MKRSVRTVVVVAVAFMLFAAAPAMACGSHRLKGSFEGATVGFNPDPTAVAERCSEGYEWILQSAGTVHLKTAVYRGDATLAAEHCSRWLTPPVEKAIGQIGHGVMTLTTPDGDELRFIYSGFWNWAGGLEGEYLTVVKMHYTVTGGTGVFADASGHGRMRFLGDETDAQWGKMRGTLFVPKS